jgi:hypothetical protein
MTFVLSPEDIKAPSAEPRESVLKVQMPWGRSQLGRWSDPSGTGTQERWGRRSVQVMCSGPGSRLSC